MSLVQKDGQIYYVFPDAANNQAYVGGPQQYQTYKPLPDNGESAAYWTKVL